jgi:hypothetical protein
MLSQMARQALFIIGAVLVSGHAGAQAQSQALKDIADTADRICGYVALSGQSTGVELTGDVKAELSKLAKVLADLGLSGTGRITNQSYEGILQQELSTTLRELRQCKLTVLTSLQRVLIPQPQPVPEVPASGDAVQAGVVVGKAFGGRRSPNDATTFEFLEITHAQQFNPREPFEYQGIKLLFQSAQSRAGMTSSRPQDGMIYGGVIAKVLE